MYDETLSLVECGLSGNESQRRRTETGGVTLSQSGAHYHTLREKNFTEQRIKRKRQMG
jgi:hypothetical protein